MNSAPAIEARALSVGIGGKPVLEAFSASFEAGQVTAIVGPNGAGKTTLLKTILRLLPLEAGQIHLLAEDISASRPHQLAGRVAYLEQAPNIYWPLSVGALVRLGLKPGRSLEGALARTGVSEFRHRSVLDLSGGERARVLLHSPSSCSPPIPM